VKNLKLLVVEDDESIRSCWEVIFSQRGWEVVSVGTVSEGLAALEPAPDYLILDLSLPDGGGEAILRKVRDENLQTRVAVTTGDNDAARLRDIKELHPEAFFRKPLNVVDVWWEGERGKAG
jgi:DNA-binding NtrC family response regulator